MRSPPSSTTRNLQKIRKRTLNFNKGTALKLKKTSEHDLYCDLSTDYARPQVTPAYRRRIFQKLHGSVIQVEKPPPSSSRNGSFGLEYVAIARIGQENVLAANVARSTDIPVLRYPHFQYHPNDSLTFTWI